METNQTTQRKHTDGPWAVQVQPTKIIIGQGSPSNITKSVVTIPFSFVGNAEAIRARADQQLKDADLIGSAPDLLAIARRYKLELENGGMNDGPVYRTVRDVIAKAEGRA